MSNVSLPLSKSYTKAALQEHSQITINKVESGELDVLETYIEAKIAIEYLSNLVKGLKDGAYDEAAKYGNAEDSKMYGCKFECSNGATKYGYSHDPVWAELNAQKEAIAEKMKAREDLMKKAMSFSGVCDDNGEEIPPANVVGGSSPSIRVTIPRK